MWWLVFQHDSDLKHPASTSKDQLQNPAIQTPDQNPTEELWRELKLHIAQQYKNYVFLNFC